MEGEEVIFSLRPYRFERYALTAIAITIVGIVFIPLAFLWAIIAERRYHYWILYLTGIEHDGTITTT